MKKDWIWLGGAGMVAIGVACTGELVDTVYFNDPSVDFGRAPSPLTVGYWGENSTRPTRYPYDWREDEANDAAAAKVAALEKTAEAARKKADYAQLRGITNHQLKLNAGPIDQLRDRQLVLSIPVKPGLSDYLAARTNGKPAEARKLLAKVPAGQYQPFVNYYRSEMDGNATGFVRAASGPSPIRGRAMIMAARTLIGQTYPYGEKARPNSAAISQARGFLNELLTNPSYQRFAWSARGWRARIDFAEKQYGNAAVAYLAQLRTAPNFDDRLQATTSLRVSLDRISTADAAIIRKAILADPRLFEPYAEYRIYHSEVGYDEAKPRTKESLASLAKFGRDVIAANPKVTIKAGVTARLAEIAYQSGDFATAQTLADRSLTTPNGERRDLARYVAAGARFRQKKTADAIKTLGQVSTAFKGSYLLAPANELKALCQQDLGDFGAALDTYRELDYKLDIAYLLDVRMSIDQIRAYRDQKPGAFATLVLGYRLLRENNLPEAKREFASIPEADRKKLAKVGDTDYRWNELPGIDVIPDPLVTTQELMKLREKTDTPADLYALASYYYNHRNLLLYNASLWDGSRQVLVSLNSGVTTREDRLLVRKHSYEHECLFVARQICLEIARRFPQAPETSKALYRAATSSRRLADFNSWWRAYGTQAELFDSAISLMKRCATEFPNEPLAANARKYAKAYDDEKRDALLQAGFAESDAK